MDFLITLIILILILGIIVFVHEFGHFIAAKNRGVYVHEFAIGMGPKIFGFKRKNDETYYSLRLLPLGGFTALAMTEEDFKVKKNRVLDNKKYWEKILILLMGILFNFILTIVLLFINGIIYGSPQTGAVVGEIQENGPAEIAGLKTNDEIVKINGKKVSSWDDVILELNYVQIDKEEYNFLVLRNQEELNIKIMPNIEQTEEGEIKTFGFGTNTKKEYGVLAALEYSIVGFNEMFTSLFKILGNLFTGKIGVDNLSGPVGVFSVIDQIKETGLESIIYLTAYLSINVGIINLIPIPVFDGGRVVLSTAEKIKGKKLNPNVEVMLNNIGVILLIILFVYVTLNDIIKIF